MAMSINLPIPYPYVHVSHLAQQQLIVVHRRKHILTLNHVDLFLLDLVSTKNRKKHFNRSRFL